MPTSKPPFPYQSTYRLRRITGVRRLQSFSKLLLTPIPGIEFLAEGVLMLDCDA